MFLLDTGLIWFYSKFRYHFQVLILRSKIFRIELIKNFQRDVNFKWPTPAPVQKISDRNIFLIRSRCGARVKITGVGIFWPRKFTSKIFELEKCARKNFRLKIFVSKIRLDQFRSLRPKIFKVTILVFEFCIQNFPIRKNFSTRSFFKLI